MPRPQRDLDPAGGPLVEFARDLRELRAAAGSPKFTTMARRTGRSKTALADASAGQHLPRWETVEDFVRACEAEPAAWRDRWVRLRRTAGEAPDAAAPDAPVPDGAAPDDDRPDEPVAVAPAPAEPSPAPAPDRAAPSGTAPTTTSGTTAPPDGRRRRRGPLPVTAVVVGILLAGALGFGLGRVTVPAAPAVPQSVEAVVVQNKVALGADRLAEDTTPAYLSSEALAYCAQPSRNCKVPGTEMGSGVAIVANCWRHGQMMWNYDVSDPTSQRNPDIAQSDLWYRASFPDGRTGYLAEVYIVRGDRGGRGLPMCSP